MIDPSEEHDPLLVKSAGLYANAAENAVSEMQLFMRMDDAAGVMASAVRARKALDEVLAACAREVLR